MNLSVGFRKEFFVCPALITEFGGNNPSEIFLSVSTQSKSLKGLPIWTGINLTDCGGITVLFCNETLYISTSFFEPSVLILVIGINALSTVRVKFSKLMMQLWALKKI